MKHHEPQWKDTLISAVFIAVLMIVLILAINKAGAHQSETGEDYSAWVRPDGGGSCCSALDCRPVQFAVGYRGDVTAIVGGRRVAIPPDKILAIRSKDGNAHFCGAIHGSHYQPIVYCFVLPEMIF